jgi:uncharacterized protein YraI
MLMKRIVFVLVLLPLFAAACAAPELPTKAPQSAARTPSVTLPPALSPTQTPAMAPATPVVKTTPELIDGLLTIKVNVRSGPGTSYASLGQLAAGEKVQITVQDGTGKWYRILYPSGSGGDGWVAAQFVQIAAGAEVPLEATPTPSGPGGRVMQRLNVRSGPGMNYDSLGILEPNVMVSLTGKNATASWFQIEYPFGNGDPGGRGWVTAQYIQTDASDRLPALDDYGTPIASSLAGPLPDLNTPTPTIGPAFSDNDSPTSPAINVTFSAFGTRRFTFSSQVSAPEGDSEDWIEFIPYASNSANARLVLSLTCSGNGALIVEMRQNDSLITGWGELACGDLNKMVTLPAGQPYEIRLAPAMGAGLRLVDYVLTMENLP